MRTTRRFACAAVLMLPAVALARPADMPPAAPEACEAPTLHEALRAERMRGAGPADQPPGAGEARCPRCGCDLFASRATPTMPEDLRNLL